MAGSGVKVVRAKNIGSYGMEQHPKRDNPACQPLKSEYERRQLSWLFSWWIPVPEQAGLKCNPVACASF